jgi:hypothetical protein
MKEYKKVITQKVLTITCDKCASVFEVGTPEFNECVSIQKYCGYGSIFGDGSTVSADFCQTCFQELVGNFITVTESNDDNDPMLMALIQASSDIKDIEPDMILDHLFNSAMRDELEVKEWKENDEEIIMLRSITEIMDTNFSFFKNIQSDEEHKAALHMMEYLIEDYDANLMLIDALSCSIKRYEDSIY